MTDSIKTLSINPVDTWFFRDGAPFNRGEDHGDFRSVFPPVSSTVSGAMRYSLAKANGWDRGRSWVGADSPTGEKIEKVLGNGPYDLGAVRFRGPFLTVEKYGENLQAIEQAVFQIPAHLLGKTDDQSGCPTFHVTDWLIPGGELASDIGKVCYPITAGHHPKNDKGDFPKPGDGFFVTAEGMSNLISGRLPATKEYLHRSRLYANESRVGIARDRGKRNVATGMLFNPHFVRLCQGVGLTLGIQGLPLGWEIPGLIALGGESRMASVATGTESLEFQIEKPEELKNTLLILLTPALLVDPNQPSSGSALKWVGAGPGESASALRPEVAHSFGPNAKVKTLVVDRPQMIGGWDSLAGKPLAMRPFARAGSVWWIENCELPITGKPFQIGYLTEHGYGVAVLAKSF